MSRSENEMESEGEEGNRTRVEKRMKTRCMRCPTVFEKAMTHKWCAGCRGCECAGGQGVQAQQAGCWITEKAGWMELNAEITEDCGICERNLVTNEMVWVSEETSFHVVHAGCKQQTEQMGGMKWYKALLPVWGGPVWYSPGGNAVRRKEGGRDCHQCGEATTPAERLFCGKCATISCGKEECGCAHARVLMEVVEEGQVVTMDDFQPRRPAV